MYLGGGKGRKKFAPGQKSNIAKIEIKKKWMISRDHMMLPSLLVLRKKLTTYW
jgi:hypothetical protein